MQEILLNCNVTKVTFTLNWNLVKVSLIGEPTDVNLDKTFKTKELLINHLEDFMRVF